MDNYGHILILHFPGKREKVTIASQLLELQGAKGFNTIIYKNGNIEGLFSCPKCLSAFKNIGIP